MMFRLIVTFVITLITVSTVSSGNKKTDKKNDHVQCVIKPRSLSLKATESGTLLISLKPNNGIHVNLTPPITVSLDTESQFTLTGKPAIPKNGTYLDIAQPIQVSYQASKKLNKGKYHLTGTLTYYYCSDAEGWCNKFKQPFDVELTLIP